MNEFKNFSPQLKSLIYLAQKISAENNFKEVCENVLLYAFLKRANLAAAYAFNSMPNISIQEVAKETHEFIKKKKKSKNSSYQFSKAVQDKITYAYNIAVDQMGLDYVDIEHLLPTFFVAPVPKPLCKCLDLPEDKVAESDDFKFMLQTIVENSLGNFSAEDFEAQEEDQDDELLEMLEENPILSKFAKNLNLEASTGMFDHIIDFDNKIDELASILCRKNKPNAILVGPAGSGKTSIVEGLAAKIVSGQAPELLLDKVIYSVNLSSMVAGTEYRGQFEKRLEDFVNEAKKHPNLILFIDEVHTLVGAGGNSNHGLEASNILKPELARGTISCIGATTTSEYAATIKKDSALDRRFEKVMVKEPSRYEMEDMLDQILSKYESFHNVIYSEEFKNKLFDFCDDFTPNRCYPDKAIDVIDQCGAQARVAFWEKSKPIRMILEDSAHSSKTNEEIEQMIEEFSQSNPSAGKKSAVVTEDILFGVFNSRRNPLLDIKNLTTFFDFLKNEAKHQNSVLEKFKKEIKLRSLGLKRNSKKGTPPVYVFFGENGSGKTSLCESLRRSSRKICASVFDYSGIEFVDYYDKYKILGNQTNNSLCERVQMHPNSVIIIDDIDQMHSSCLAIMRQILKEGRISTPSGETVDFSSCIFLFTTKSISGGSSMGFNTIQRELSPFLPDLIKSCEHKSFLLKKLSLKDLVRIFHSRIEKIKSSTGDTSLLPEFTLWEIRKFIYKHCRGSKDVIKSFEDAFDKHVVQALC